MPADPSRPNREAASPPSPPAPPVKKKGLAASVAHVGEALGYSLSGLAAGVRLSLAFRQELLVLATLIAALAWTGKPAAAWLLCLGGWLPVMALELLNTALEETLDMITREWSATVKAAKDMASAAVFLLLLLNGGLWLHVFVLA